HISIDRPDGNSRINKLSLELPPGEVGSLTTAPLCSAEGVDSGNCPEASKVGLVRATVGTAGANLQVTGSLYIAKPSDAGDVASLLAVIPAKVGPIDLGQVAIVNHVKLRQSDGGLTATSDDIPTALGGIPLAVRNIEVTVNRDGFLRNPT